MSNRGYIVVVHQNSKTTTIYDPDDKPTEIQGLPFHISVDRDWLLLRFYDRDIKIKTTSLAYLTIQLDVKPDKEPENIQVFILK